MQTYCNNRIIDIANMNNEFIHELSQNEAELFESLPKPPSFADIQPTNVWIVEWLLPDDQPTGRLLYEWMNHQRPGWAEYFSCKNKMEVIQAIKRAEFKTQNSEMIPVLHLESHGCEAGLEGSDGSGGREQLTWEELTEPLQQLNLVTRCNLLVFVAACIGFAGIQTFCRGPRVAAVALIGPDDSIMPKNLLEGTKEFYRRWMDGNPALDGIAEDASREAGAVGFEPEPSVILVYESWITSLIKSIRPAEYNCRKERLRQCMFAKNSWSAPEIESRLADLPPLPLWEELQQIWDEMFMIDLYPNNRERFGIDMKTIRETIVSSREELCNSSDLSR
jgi:hypothetical protein